MYIFIGGGNSGSKLYKIDLTEEIPKVEWLADDVAFYNVLKDEKNIVFLNSLKGTPYFKKRCVFFRYRNKRNKNFIRISDQKPFRI